MTSGGSSSGKSVSSNLRTMSPFTPFTPITITGSGSVQVVAIGSTPLLSPPSENGNPDIPLKSMIRSQIEYYFSHANLDRDMFIRKRMDSQGYLAISLIASFHRVQSLTTDLSLIIDSLLDSDMVQLSDNHLKARPKHDPTKWPLIETTESPGGAAAIVSSDLPLGNNTSDATGHGAGGSNVTSNHLPPSPPSAQSNTPSSPSSSLIPSSEKYEEHDVQKVLDSKSELRKQSLSNPNGGLKLTNGDTSTSTTLTEEMEKISLDG